MKILIVDDAMFMRKVIRRTLEANGYTDIYEAGDGEQALEIFKEEHPQLVLLDITMPGMSGLEVLEKIMVIDGQTKVIMCSAMGQEMMIQKAIFNGALDFIVKPFKEEEFMRVIRQACGE